MLEYSDEDGSDYEDFDEDVDADSYGDDDEDSDEDSDEEVPLDVLLARLLDSQTLVREKALYTLSKLDPATLSHHADALVATLEASQWHVRYWALRTLRELEELAFAQHAHAVVGKLNDPFPPVRELAFTMLRGLPLVVTRNIDFESHNLRERLLGRLAWYNCLLRLRVRRITLYWYALPYRPSGPGHARDVEAWGRMHEE